MTDRLVGFDVGGIKVGVLHWPRNLARLRVGRHRAVLKARVEQMTQERQQDVGVCLQQPEQQMDQ